MTVKELIAKLSECDPDAEIRKEPKEEHWEFDLAEIEILFVVKNTFAGVKYVYGDADYDAILLNIE